MDAPTGGGEDDAALAALRQRIDALPPLREILAAEGMTAKKSLGQHFLFDFNLTDKIARTARMPGAPTDAPLAGQTVVEVGPGPGGLTRSLLKAGAHVIAVEKDARAATILAPLEDAAAGRLTVHITDALTADWTAIAPEGAIICSNLPYNVATPLLVGWLTKGSWPSWWANATIMVQREVANRITAAPTSEAYGRLGVLAGVRAHTESVFDIAPSAFVPPPKVWSSVVRLDPKPDAARVPIGALSQVTAAAFGQRRKMLRSSLKALTKTPEALLSAADIAPTERAEQLSLDAFVRLAEIYASEGRGQ
ncbi:16S rRNA (adenine(1518)-N(6)/adenine(1519)-N(6))-dimethyltransferase RsmA [Acuticoccus sp. M5D2P5]|uniref:16S rRNA (adenine(1518)-N(6)/adenine(1519)-N(6))- dimethyltransferase RsmA n=1 Tax=Acuticoccus kalidii TaxID=2910977 RepID=UPI001F27D0BB|nr:16S rRNA (adenine(1518)-N(6)/adenine(1519)-N(6))-dimethyltransferase RsmA [Acuticoccus kalidii]MCF3935538.1 16S rRNA (adenine(1518)-N(6)/adenine(1519)-N(6))-dimethyltransferase RsmA [Acuticoccus kalidii]